MGNLENGSMTFVWCHNSEDTGNGKKGATQTAQWLLKFEKLMPHDSQTILEALCCHPSLNYSIAVVTSLETAFWLGIIGQMN